MTQSRISQEEIDTKYRNFQKKAVSSSLTIDTDEEEEKYVFSPSKP